MINSECASYLLADIFGEPISGRIEPLELKETETLESVLQTLSEQEQLVLELRYGLKDGRPRRLREISPALGNVTVQRVSQINNKALRKLRHPSRSRRLKDFLKPVAQSTAASEPEVVLTPRYHSPYQRCMRERKIKKPVDRLEGAILKLAQALDTSRLSEIPQDENLRIIEALQVLQEKANAAHEHLSGAKPVQETDFQERQQP
jgi:hypothetical protein